MSFGKQIIKAVAAVTLVMSMELTACSQKNSIDSGIDVTPSVETPSVETSSVETSSVETPSVETPNEEDDKIEISMEDVIAIGKEEAVKYYDDLLLTNVYSYDNDHDRSVMS